MNRVVAFEFLRHDDYTLVLLGVAVVLIVAHLAGRLFKRLGQPPVIGEVVAGLCLGPSVLGHFSETLYPLEGRPLLKMLSSVGLVVFMFLTGLELNLTHLNRHRNRVAASVAVTGTVIPFVFGMALAFALRPSNDRTGFTSFMLFMGAAMSITAFPVLARILIERRLYTKPLGVLTMACAAGDDVLTWATLAVVVAIVSSASGWELPYVAAASVAFGAVLVWVVRPLLQRVADARVTSGVTMLVVAGIFTCSFLTSAIGVHEIFGAFLLGAIFPRGALATELAERLSPVAVVLLPVFFVTTGLNVDLGAIGLDGVWRFGLILLVACSGKFVGTILGARSQGLALRESVALGVLMNTRGLTELVVLSIGLDLGLLDRDLYALLVLMAVVTTVATAPILRWIRPDPYLGQPPPPEGDGSVAPITEQLFQE